MGSVLPLLSFFSLPVRPRVEILNPLRYISTHSAGEIADHVPEFWVEGNRELYVEALEANLGMFSPDGRMPEDGPANVLDTLTLVDPTLDPDSIDLLRTYDNAFFGRVPD